MPLDGVDPVRLRAALEKATAALLSERNKRGFWEGSLSSSALSTATAVTTLALASKQSSVTSSQLLSYHSQISLGLRWLASCQNPDGGWGDTTKSLSNISTTTLCWAAFGACDADGTYPDTVRGVEEWLKRKAGGIEPHQLAQTIIARYGKDRTFSVPILTMCALAGRLGTGRQAWRDVIPLPFELAALPHQLFAALRLPVVSYALPALIAIGLARHVHAPSRNPFARTVRDLTREKTLRVLTDIQPSNGGFLEATPLTSFVTMSLIASGQADHIVAKRGIEFLQKAQRADGSWPIDTNLSTWCTTLAIEALPSSQLSTLNARPLDWLLTQQYRIEHPYSRAAPGGWAWTDLPGGVPDADDTSGALLALAKMRNVEDATRTREISQAAEAGVCWLLNLQNSDGGIPTFCRGWGALPFDRSSADITAHAIRAWLAWHDELTLALRDRISHALGRALDFLAHSQRTDGSWLPLWFGNQQSPDDENPTYGTARVLNALATALKFGLDKNVKGSLRKSMQRAFEAEAKGELWMVVSQHKDGGWAGGSSSTPSVEETALAVEALAKLTARDQPKSAGYLRSQLAVASGIQWLSARIESGTWCQPSPIGFYFAKLWYYERLYPIIFTVGALRQVTDALNAKLKSGDPKIAA